VFLVIAAAGLLYVKWWPYYHKAFTAAQTHSIGASIVTGKAAAAPAPSWHAAWDYAKTYFLSVWKAAVLGILLGSLIQVLLPSRWLLKALGKADFKSTAIAGLASIPGMMCTCCAAPMAVGLRRKKVSAGAALAFWIGNPAINPATLVFMTFVLSWKFTLLRLVFGLILTFGVSYLANRFAGDARVPSEIDPDGSGQPAAVESGPLLIRWLKSAGLLSLHIVPAYIATVLVLGAFRAWLFPAIGTAASESILVIIGVALAGMLFVIPTAAEIPIIQSLMSYGMGAGPAGALLVTLPTVSLPSLLMLSRSFPARVLLFIAGSVVVLGIAGGLAAMAWL
jgi:hypothetical protein